MLSSLRYVRKIALYAGILSAVFSMAPGISEAASILSVHVNLTSTDGEMPPSVRQRIEASLASIGNRVLVGKEAEIFQNNRYQYDKVLADIVNRVVVGYVVSDMSLNYGQETTMNVVLMPVGQTIKSVRTEVDYGNLTPLAQTLVKEDLAGLSGEMNALLTGLPVDSIGWADRVSQSAGQTIVKNALPEFDARLHVESGENTVVHVSLLPQGTIVRRGVLTFRKTTVPRLFMYNAANKAEGSMRSLEGLPVAFVDRHKEEIREYMQNQLEEDSFIRRYDLELDTDLHCGSETELLVDELTDHWIIQGQAWLDAGRSGEKNTAIEGLLGHYVKKHDVVFGEARFYPGPVDGNLYGGWLHYFGKSTYIGYKYDFTDRESHWLLHQGFGRLWEARYDRNVDAHEDEIGISYKLHNYMTLEYVYNSEDGSWLRLIANL